MGLENIKKKLQPEGATKPKRQRTVIGMSKAVSKPITFEDMCIGEERYQDREDTEDIDGESEDSPETPTYQPPRELTDRERWRQQARNHQEILARYRRAGLRPPF